MRTLSLLLLAATGAVAQSATIAAGVVVGYKSANLDNFKGIPYAMPPTGSRRLVAPAKYTATYVGGTFSATMPSPTACPQFTQAPQDGDLAASIISTVAQLPIFQFASNEGEDCLSLNVQRPQGAGVGSNLPVVVWIYGGAFEGGQTSTYDAANLIQQSVKVGNPILYVEMNYRLGGFGFLAGSQLSAEKNTNLGLRDQRLAIQWVHDNVAAFGGDPTKVTIMGESAGSISVLNQMVINGGNNTASDGKKLFRGAIMSSGSVIPAQTVTSLKAQNIFNAVAAAAKCPLDAKVLTCLRNLPFAQFKSAVNSVPGSGGYRSIDLSYLPRPDPNDGGFFTQSPELSILQGKYTKIPIIIGGLEDEGPLFALSQRNISTTADLQGYAQSYFTTASPASVNAFVNTYPDDQTAGSPFRTGNDNQLYPQYKRLAAILGDLAFILQRRLLLNNISGTVPSWSYVGSFLHGFPFLGTFHGTDALEYYYNFPNGGVAKTFQTFFTSFIVYQNPNTISDSSTSYQSWPQYSTANPQLLNVTGAGFFGNENVLSPDTFRAASYASLANNWSNFRV